MSIGLDLGGIRFRSLRRRGDRLIARQCAAAYAIILDNPARRELFAERLVPFAEFGLHLILFGDAAVEWSDRLSVTPIPLRLDERPQFEDRIIRQVLAALMEGLLPRPETHPADCCIALPAGLEAWKPADAGFLMQALGGFGYRPSITSRSLAVALSELSGFGMSGLGVYLGTTGSELSIVRQGRELARIDLPRTQPLSSAIEPLREIFATAAFELHRRPEAKALVAPVALAVSGEAIAEPGLAELLPNCVQHASWPFAVQTVPIAAEPDWSVGRGCLIQAELEQLAESTRSAA